MKKISFLSIFAFLLGFNASAQAPNQQLASNDYAKAFANLMNTKNKIEKTQGSPYVFDEWESGIVVFRGEEGGERRRR